MACCHNHNGMTHDTLLHTSLFRHYSIFSPIAAGSIAELKNQLEERKACVGILIKGCTCAGGQYYTFANVKELTTLEDGSCAIRLACGTGSCLVDNNEWFIPDENIVWKSHVL